MTYWQKYLDECKDIKMTPSMKDYLIWLEDNDLIDEELEKLYEEAL